MTVKETIEERSTRTVETPVADVVKDVLDDETNNTEDLCPNNDFCFTEEDFLEARTNMNEATRHTGTYNSTWSKIRDLEGADVVVKNSDGEVIWKIVNDVEDDVFVARRELEHNFFKECFSHLIDDEYVDMNDASKIFWELWPRTIDCDLEKLNNIIEKKNTLNKKNLRRTIKKVSKPEFIVFHALLIGASIFCQQGEKLWAQDEKGKQKMRGIMKGIDFGQWMKAWRFCQIKALIPMIMESESLNALNNDWWKLKQRIIDFNSNRKKKLYASYALVFDESMSSYVPR